VTEQCQDKLSVYIGNGQNFEVFCDSIKGHPANHHWTGYDTQGRKVKIRWTQSNENKETKTEAQQ
jgi:hypothetical protein